MSAIKLSNVSSKYGAPMGRPHMQPAAGNLDKPRKFRLHRVYLDNGGYDNGGAYWGSGDPLYRAVCVESEAVGTWAAGSFVGHVECYQRARTRQDAKDLVLAYYSGATFYR